MRQLLCRHDVGLLANWSPEDICIYVACPKCGKIYGHFHLPTYKGGKPKEMIH